MTATDIQPAIATLQSFVDAINDDDMPRALTLLSTDFHYEDPLLDLVFDGPEPFGEFMVTWLGELGRRHWRLEHVAPAGERCAASWVFSGTQLTLPPAEMNFYTGEPVPTPDGYPFLTRGISTFRFDRDWLLAEEIDYWTGAWVAPPTWRLSDA